jgi:hypothetical protein
LVRVDGAAATPAGVVPLALLAAAGAADDSAAMPQTLQ